MINLINYYEKRAPSGDFAKIKDKDVILISLRNIVTTPKGSRMFLPDFGTSLYLYLFDPLDNDTISALQEEITTQISEWEDRITLHRVEIKSAVEEQSIFVNIVFSFNDETLNMPITISGQDYYEDINTDFTLPFFKPKRVS